MQAGTVVPPGSRDGGFARAAACVWACVAGSALGAAAPAVLTLLRLVTAQALLLANVEMMAGHERLRTSLDPGWWARMVVGLVSSDPGHVVAAACPILLAAGLLARPAALLLLAETALLQPTISLRLFTSPWDLLLLSTIVLGPGRLSVDGLFRSGLTRSAVPGAAAVSRWYRDLDRFGAPVLLLAVRLAVGSALLKAGWAAPAVGVAALLLMAGFAVRPVAAGLLVCLAASGHLPAGSPTAFLPFALLLLLLSTRSGGLLAPDWLLERRLSRSRRRAGPVPHVVIVGAGFGGVATARALRASPCAVTLVDRENHHLFQPLLYQVATATLSPADIAVPIRSLSRGQDNLSVLLGEVTGVDRAARTVAIGERTVSYDFLVIATGAEHSYLGHDAWRQAAPGLKTLADATAIRGRILSAFEAAEATDDEALRQALLTFVVVGGGPTGVELAGSVADLAHLGLLAEYRASRPERARVVLVHAGERLLPAFPATLSRRAERALREAGVEVMLSARAEAIDPSGVKVGGLELPARTVIWAAGVKASPAAAWLGVEADRAGRVIVDECLRAGGADVFVVGDTASSLGWKGAAVPGLAPAAKQEGHYAAQVIRARLTGRRPPAPFRYQHYGDLATIGRKSAVASFGPIRASGAPAWWLWGVAHVAFLVGGRNRAAVLLAWFWNYLTLSGGTRLIIRARYD